MLSRMVALRISKAAYPALSALPPVVHRGCLEQRGQITGPLIRAQFFGQQVRSVTMRASDVLADANIDVEIRQIMFDDTNYFLSHTAPPAYAQAYIAWLSTLTAGNMGLATTLAVISLQPLLLPAIMYGKMWCYSLERALKPYILSHDRYLVRLKKEQSYPEAWRAYRSRRDMLTWSGFRLPYKMILNMLEYPMMGSMIAGAVYLSSSLGGLGKWLWMADLGAADPTFICPMLFYYSCLARMLLSSPTKYADVDMPSLAFYFSMFTGLGILFQTLPAVVFWMGLVHNLCVLSTILFLRRDHFFHNWYVPKMNDTIKSMVQREVEGKAYALPHVTKMMDRFAPELGKRPLLLADIDPESVPPPTVPALHSGSQSALAQLPAPQSKRAAVEEARKAPREKVRRR